MQKKSSTPRKPQATKAPTAKAPATRAQVDELAAQIAAVLNNPLTPPCIYKPLAEAVTDLYMPPRYTDQPEFIGDCLASFLGLDWRQKGGAR
jgi:hypothetical protein